MSESPLVGDVVDVVSRFGVLSVNSSNLDMELSSDGFEFRHSNAKLWQGDMD